MTKRSKHTAHDPRPLFGLVAGIVAGIAASAAMEAFQGRAAKTFGAEGDPAGSATAKAAATVVETTTGQSLRKADRPAGGRLVHYAVGAALGGAYGLVAEYRPGVASGFGSGYGLVTSALLDEGAVPALGLGEPPQKTPLGIHLFGAASHLVFGMVLEGTRSMLVERRT